MKCFLSPSYLPMPSLQAKASVGRFRFLFLPANENDCRANNRHTHPYTDSHIAPFSLGNRDSSAPQKKYFVHWYLGYICGKKYQVAMASFLFPFKIWISFRSPFCGFTVLLMPSLKAKASVVLQRHSVIARFVEWWDGLHGVGWCSVCHTTRCWLSIKWVNQIFFYFFLLLVF